MIVISIAFAGFASLLFIAVKALRTLKKIEFTARMIHESCNHAAEHIESIKWKVDNHLYSMRKTRKNKDNG